MVTSYFYGHPAYFDEALNNWRYCDTDEPIQIPSQRPCPQCRQLPSLDGHDACLGTIPDACAACCGHGVEMGYIAWDCSGKGQMEQAWEIKLFGRTLKFSLITELDGTEGLAVSDPRMI